MNAVNNRQKNYLWLFAYAAMLFIPVIAFLIGWIGWDEKKGMIAALVTFTLFFILGGVFLILMKDISPVAASIPFFFGLVYTLLPNFLPGPFDNTAVAVAGALLSLVLWLRRQPDLPRWIIVPVLLSSLYVLVGGLITGVVDELIVFCIAAALSAYGLFHKPTLKVTDLVHLEPPPPLIGNTNGEKN
jgi:hypothetical protein